MKLYSRVCQFLKKVKCIFTYDPTIPLLCNYSREVETQVYIQTCTQIVYLQLCKTGNNSNAVQLVNGQTKRVYSSKGFLLRNQKESY